MKNKIICILVMVLLIVSGIIIYKKNNVKKVYLSDKYYNNGEFIDISFEDLDKYKNDVYVLYIYNNYCAFSIPCEDIFKEYMEKYNIDFVSMRFEEFKKSSYYNKIKYGPSVILINKGKIVTYLNPEKDNDISKYQINEDFENWINKYIYNVK